MGSNISSLLISTDCRILVKSWPALPTKGLPLPFLSYGGTSLAITMAAHTSLGTMPIVLSGSKEQKEKYVPDLASGKMLGSFGLTEPGAGSDAGATQTTAELIGDEYVINGGKIFITNAGEAGLISLTAQIIKDGEKVGIGAFIVPMDTEGLEIAPKEKKMGWRASDTRQLFFSDIHIDLYKL